MTLPDTTPDPELPAVDRPVAGATLSDGGVVIYDPRRADAWVRSGVPCDLEQYR